MEINFETGHMDYSKYQPIDMRFNVPKGLTKKEYKQIDKEAKEEIQRLIVLCRTVIEESQNIFHKLNIEDYGIKRQKIKRILQFFDCEKKDLNITKAKQYPIDNLIDFDGGGFARCIWHSEKTGSMKYYPKENIVYCFGGCGKHDAIDIYQKLNNVDLLTAVKALS